MNLSTIIDRGARHFGDRTAIVFGPDRISYRMLRNALDKVASYLKTLGVSTGDRVALFLPNQPAWIALYYAIIRVGGVVVCASPHYRELELKHMMADSGCRLVVTCDALGCYVPAGDQLPAGVGVLTVESDPVLSTMFRDFDGLGNSRFAPHDALADDVCAILYTGGTTGAPKGAMLTHQNLLFTSQNVCYHERRTDRDKALCFMPLNHVFGGCHIMNATFYGCGALVLHAAFDMDAILASIKQHEITRFYAVPTVFIRLLNTPDAKRVFQSVGYSFSAAASMAPEIVRKWEEQFGLRIHEAYGMTETSSLVSFNHMYEHRVGSVGTPAGVVEVKILDETGREVPVGENGEVVIRGPNIMKGYFNKPVETAAALKDGWLYSGDVGRFDEDGYLYIVDRLKDMIISGGYNVYPNEVEEMLYTHEAVEECAVIGTPDLEFGETVTAFVRLKCGFEADQETLRIHCKAKMAAYKAPKRIVFVSELPKSPTGKILRREIRKKY